MQIGGPTAAFVPVVFNVIDKFGYGGLILCTILAGIMLIAGGVLRIGTLLKYIPKPVITGFTAGIAVSIFSSQVKDAARPDDGQGPGRILRALVGLFRASAERSAPAALALVGGQRRRSSSLMRRYRPVGRDS